MFKMATCADCNEIAGEKVFTENLNKCPTKAEIVAKDAFVITGSYADNQLVSVSDIFAKPTLSVSPTTQAISSMAGGSFYLKITCNTTWKVVYPSWCRGTTSGTGNASIRVTVASNTDNSRSGSITVTTTAPSKNISKTCAVSQSGLPTIRLGVYGSTTSGTYRITASAAVKDAMTVNIQVNTLDGVSTGSAVFRTGDTEALTSVWPAIFDQEHVTGYRIENIACESNIYDNPPIITGNAIYKW